MPGEQKREFHGREGVMLTESMAFGSKNGETRASIKFASKPDQCQMNLQT